MVMMMMMSLPFLLLTVALFVAIMHAHEEEATDSYTMSLGRRPKDVSRAFHLHGRPWASKNALALSTNTRPLDTPPSLVFKQPPFSTSQAHEKALRQLPEQNMLGDLVTLGEYYLELDVGGQIVNVQIDTGSSTLAVPLKQCRNCLSNDHRLDLAKTPTKSIFVQCDSPVCRPNSCQLYGRCSACSRYSKACCSTVDPDKCGFFLMYADGSGASGALVQVDVTMANITVSAYVGAILNVVETFENSLVDGILGMAFESLACNPTCVLPLFDVMVREKKVKRDVFSICTGRYGGLLTLGGSNPDFYHGEMKYVPLVRRQQMHFYDVRITGVRIDGVRVSVPDFTDGIVDSGTTVLVVAPKAYAAFRQYFQTHFCNVPGLCPNPSGRVLSRRVDLIRITSDDAALLWLGDRIGNMTLTDDIANMYVKSQETPTWFSPGYCAALSDEDVALLPSISIMLTEGVTLTIEPELYMFKYVLQSGFWGESKTFRCLGMAYLPELDQMENNVILGDAVMQKYYVEFDRERMRIGFAVSHDCVQADGGQISWMSGMSTGYSLNKHAFSPTFLTSLFILSCLAWVFVIFLWTRKTPRNEYVPIS